MSTVNSLMHESRHAISFYDDEKNNQVDIEALREIAMYFLSEGYGVIYGVEEFENTDIESENSIAKKIVEGKGKLNGTTDDKDFLQMDKATTMDKLMIINPNSMYADNNTPSDIVNYWSLQYSKAAQKFRLKDNNVKGIMGINIPDPYFARKQFDKFFDFEEGIEKVFDGKIGLLCCYKKKWLEEFTLPQFIRMLGSHGTVIDDDLSIIRWSVNKLLDIITKTLDLQPKAENNDIYKKESKKDAQDEDTQRYSSLLFETIRNRYQIDRDSLIADPQKFEDILSKMLGKNSYEELSNNIKVNFIKEIFGHSDQLGSSQR